MRVRGLFRLAVGSDAALLHLLLLLLALALAPGSASAASCSVDCAPGYACPSPTAPAYPCLAGTYSTGNATYCSPCPVGYECPLNAAGLSVGPPVPCAPG